jgi:nucleotide-binding universal stress UspA family protein
MIKIQNKKILILMNFDPKAFKIADEGFTIAKEMGAGVILVRIQIDYITYSLTYMKLDQTIINDDEMRETTSRDFLDKSKSFQPDIGLIQRNVKVGSFAKSILNTARELKVDLIVMGSLNSRWLEELVLGRIMNEELQKSTVPFCIIHGKDYSKKMQIQLS